MRRTPEAPSGGPLIEVRGLRRLYGQGESAVLALDGVDLDVPAGEMVALMGPSGSGKSTLMHVLGLLDRPTGGTYRLGGRDVGRIGSRAAAALRGRRIAFVFQGIHLIPRLSLLGNVELPMLYARMPVAERRRRAEESLGRVGIAHLGHRMPSHVSGGQAQRAAIARAVAPGPDLLLADEPTGALDRRAGQDVLAIFQELNRELGLTVAMVTHDPYVAQHAERIVQLMDGRVVADRPVADRLLVARADAAVDG